MAVQHVCAVFNNLLKSLNISPSSSVGVAVSEKWNGLALAYLAKQFFKCNVVGMTVDHQYEPESRQEVLKVKNIVEAIGIEHCVLKLEKLTEYEKSTMKQNRQVIIMRDERNRLLLDECRKRNLSALFLGDYADDQMELFLKRLSFATNFYALACEQSYVPYPVQCQHTSVPIVRPLLTLKKDELQQVCLHNGIQWIENSCNSPSLTRQEVCRLALDNHLEIHEGLFNLIEMFRSARKKINEEMRSVLPKMVNIDSINGYVTVSYSVFSKLSPAAAQKMLGYLLMFVRCNRPHSLPTNVPPNLIHSLRSGEKRLVYGTYNLCVIFHHDSENFGIARRFTGADFTEIKVGETIHWCNWFKISLSPLDERDTERFKGMKFYVRNMLKQDYDLAVEGIRKVRSIRLPPPMSRGGLPVIVVEKRHIHKKKSWPIVLIPHFKYILRKYGVKCSYSVDIKRNLESFVTE